MFGVPAAPAAEQNLPTRAPRSSPPVGRGVGAAGADATPKIGDFRPAPKQCLKNIIARSAQF